MNETSVLACCLDRLSWSPERLAREINRVCGADTISPKAPYNWLKGSCPRRRLPHVVADILTDRLGEPVTVQALWPGRFPAGEECLARVPAPRPAPDAGSEPSPHAPRSAQRPRLTAAAPAPRTAATEQELMTTAVDWLLNPDPEPGSQLRGEEVDHAALDVLNERIAQLRRLDDDRGGRLVLDWAAQDLRWARTLTAECSYDPATGVRLHRAVAELGQLVGWIAADLGIDDLARQHLLLALRAARAAGDRALAAHVISCLSYRAAWNGHGQDALRLSRIARKGSAGEPAGPGQALLATREARAHASLDDPGGCQRALEEAAELAEAGPRGGRADAPWSYWVTPAVLVADAGRAWLELGKPARAARDLAHGLRLFDDSQPRNRLLHWASLAEARLQLDDVDGAAAAADAALDLAEHVNSMRATARLTWLRSRFRRCDGRAARQTVQRADDLLGGERRLAVC
ncbi:hypothetical protein AB0K09_25690 [Streptomyces sp. NPDC049577]|uniref:hypothetical protein n=1 Tax=Streptomyces sp. NPDC049577 TaxID=3155153 RepID=UPI00341D2FB8